MWWNDFVGVMTKVRKPLLSLGELNGDLGGDDNSEGSLSTGES